MYRPTAQDNYFASEFYQITIVKICKLHKKCIMYSNDNISKSAYLSETYKSTVKISV